jgi:hypothetical protein
MPRVKGFLRILSRRDHLGRPVDPDYGIDEGELPDIDEPGRPGQGLPGWPGRPGQGLPGAIREMLRERWEGRPSHPIERPPWERPDWPPGPTDPEWGIPEEGGGEDAGQLPGEIDPEDPPPMLPMPPIELPPGSIWPPLPPTAPPGKHWFLIYISGVGHRYGVFEVPERPEKPERPERPDRPPRPDRPAGGPGGTPPQRPIPSR